jgi:hypothetical protein
MLPQNHFFIGLIASVILYFGFPDIGILNLVVFLLASVLIDVDHYLYYVYKKKDWSLVNSVRWFLKKRAFMRKAGRKVRNEVWVGFFFLHGIEVLTLIWLLGFFIWDIFYFVLLGFLLHLILDYVHQIRERDRFDKFSIVYDYFKYKKLKFIDELDK